MNPFQDLNAIKIDQGTIFLDGHYCSGDFRDLLDFQGTAHVMLSGGADSQTMSSWLRHRGVPQKAYTYAALWGDEVINATDVVQAQRYAQAWDLNHTVIDFDLREFYASNEYIEVAKRYQCRSPQVAVHLKFMEQLGTDNIVTGGEPTTMIGGELNKPAHFGLSTNLFLNYHSVYKRFSEVNSVDVHRNWFWLTPEIFWSAMRANLDLLCDGYFYKPGGELKEDIHYKNRLYQAQGFDILPLGVKYTGFENLKKLLAIETGNYDEYDQRYRKPLGAMIPAPEWDNPTLKVSDDFDELIREYRRLWGEGHARVNLASWRYDF